MTTASLPILYSFRRCPYAMRARLAIGAAGLRVELREIVLRDKAPEFLEVSPSATVPCLVDVDGTVFDESLDIMTWALERDDPERWLSPEGGDRDAMIRLIGDIDGPFKRHLDRYKYDTRYPDADRVGERSAAADILRKLDAMLAGRDWLFGTRASLADFAILPFVRQFANADRAWFDGEDWDSLKRWLVAFETSPRFEAIMRKSGRWSPEDPPVIFGGDL
ncbi:glutathione S-transferase [Roseibium aquae]|uniref:Glutathione S-transferase n=1 Tax=Roseibium aquae TaxID=1323746 RepID=A0A916TNF5_9HYPH|nr:glutathione S-transferase [Roseibium aquae]GGB63155.1 glutathione S-transferase [Roseibium aquae]